MPESKKLLEINDLCMEFKSESGKKIKALRNISFDINEGEEVVITTVEGMVKDGKLYNPKDKKEVSSYKDSNDLVNAFGNTFLVINPGSLMLTGHLSENVLRAGLFAYGND